MSEDDGSEPAVLEFDIPFGPLNSDVTIEGTTGSYASVKFTPTVSLEYHDQSVFDTSPRFCLKVNPVGDEKPEKIELSEENARLIVENTGGWQYVE